MGNTQILMAVPNHQPAYVGSVPNVHALQSHYPFSQLGASTSRPNPRALFAGWYSDTVGSSVSSVARGTAEQRPGGRGAHLMVDSGSWW